MERTRKAKYVKPVLTRRNLLTWAFLPFVAGAETLQEGSHNKHLGKFMEAWNKMAAAQTAFAAEYNKIVSNPHRKDTLDWKLWALWEEYTFNALPEMLSKGRKALDSLAKGE